MNTEGQNYQAGDFLDYTPATARVAGEIVQVAGLGAMCATAIAANKKGAAQVKGVIKVRAAGVVGNEGDPVWWDENGNPYGGTAGAGAATTVASSGDFLLGSLAAALGATDGECKVRLNEYPADRPAWPNRVHETKSANYTVDTEDTGKVIHVDTDAKVITLPAIAAGLIDIVIVNDGADGTVAVNISPNSVDKIMGPDIAGTDNKDLINTKATAKRGDFVHLSGNHADGWFVTAMRGIWATET
ncbi:MAG: DUF2190 family protein [Phycisphaerae bacterium]|nr:DUF2190 family protein [Phycisphaerae bacterium]NIS53329.1 DUF2190 family protein [Phycisphaerae bacterium]NIX30483.1 DUF2190 family protein [Phycisphaerae bacterium]